MKRLLIIALLLAVAGGAYWKLNGAPAASTSAPAGGGGGGPPGGMAVEAIVLSPQAFAHEIIAVGTLRSEESVRISSEIGGRVKAIPFREGKAVAKGTVLFEIEDSVYQAELAQTRASLRLSQRNHERAVELFDKGLVSARERDEAAAKLALDQATTKLAEARLAKTRILAPFAGVTGLRLISPGAYINPGQDLVSLEALDTLKADFRLAEAALSVVSVGQKLNLDVDAYPGEVFTGTVYAIDPSLSLDTRSIGLRARMSNDHGRLRPGLFARVRLVISKKSDALLVPEQAVFPQGNALFAYVIEDGKAALRPVTLGQRENGRAEITSGLKAGDTVITAGLQKIGPGAPVNAINLAAPEAAPATN